MHISAVFTTLALALAAASSPVEVGHLQKRVSQSIYDDLVRNFKYASSAYGSETCLRPSGNTLVTLLYDLITDTNGFIARDDTRKEIVVSLRGSTSITDWVTNAGITLSPILLTGVNAPTGSLAHTGFQTAYNSISVVVLSNVRTQLAAHPDYTLVTSGHSLGGALSSLAAVSLKGNFPSATVKMFTYGQPRVFNPTAAKWVNSQFGSNAFRATHTTDGVPNIIPTYFGYAHFGVEYWQQRDPSSAANTKQCSADGEDATCAKSTLVTTIGPAHLTYFGIAAATAFCL